MDVFSRTLHRIAALACCLISAACCVPAQAGVIVIANRTVAPVRFTALAAEAASAEPPLVAAQATSPAAGPGDPTTKVAPRRDAGTAYSVQPNDCVVLACNGEGGLVIRGIGARSYHLQPYGMYFLGTTKGGEVELTQIGVGDASSTDSQGSRAASAAAAQPPDAKSLEARRTIRLAIYVDDDEPTVARVWKKRLSERIAAASTVLERYCGMKLAIDSFGKWESNDNVNDFALTLREFETTARPKNARLSIGFTSQYQLTRGRVHLGGTRGPLGRHILLREWSNHVTEVERLELLLHELSHFLGAVHSPESISVMRPVLGDRQANLKSFRIGIDPLNTMAMNIVAEEMRNRGISSFAHLSEPSRERLKSIYSTLAKAQPEDAAAEHYLKILELVKQLRR